MTENPQTEKLAADQILQKGVCMKMRTPFLCRLIGWKTVSLMIKSPYEGTLHRVASYYLGTGIMNDELDNITVENALALMSIHGKSLTKAVACAWLNGYWSGKLFTNLLASYMRWHCTGREILVITQMILLYAGTSDFINTTRLVRAMKLTAPRMGQQIQGS